MGATGSGHSTLEPRRRSPAQHRDEIILALDLYVRAGCLGGGSLPLKLANLRAVERAVAVERGVAGASSMKTGMTSYRALARSVFEEFVDRLEDLPLEAEAVWATAGFARASMARDARGAYLVARDAPIGGGGILTYESAVSPAGLPARGEAALVLASSQFLERHGHRVSGRHYLAEGESRPLRADLLAKDLNVLVEAKSTDARSAIRSAIGQLYDYRRFEPSSPELAVLVPTEHVSTTPSGQLCSNSTIGARHALPSAEGGTHAGRCDGAES